MAFVSKLVLFSSKSLRFKKFGAPAAYVRQILLPVSSYHRLEILNAREELKSVRSFNDYVPVSRTRPKLFVSGKFNKLNLPVILDNADQLSQGFLMATFHKLCIIYHKNKEAPNFHKEIDYFSNSRAFRNLCSAIHKELPKITPAHLPYLLNLVHFKVSAKSVLMKKIFTLLLDNLHCLSVCDLLEVYSDLKQKNFDNAEEAIKLREACELYFESNFEDEISQCQYIKDLIYFIADENLPLKVRQLITEKFLDEIDSEKYHLPILPRFYRAALNEPIVSLYKDDLIEKLKIIITDHLTGGSQVSFSTLYKTGVHKYEYLYNADLCEKFTINSLRMEDRTLIAVAENLVKIGYFNQEMVDKVADAVLSSEILKFKPRFILCIASIFARTCFHEMNNPYWSKIKSTLEYYINREDKILDFPYDVYELCEYLMFLGCDVTDLLERIFKNAVDPNFFLPGSDARNLLRLHHLARKYYPKSTLGLSKKTLNQCLQAAAYKKTYHSHTLLHEFFGSEDYVLHNCLTTEFHFLPSVVVLGPDNKPIDLSAYKPQSVDLFFNLNYKVVTNINNIEKPPGSRTIVFFEFPDGQPKQFRNAPLTSGYWKCFIEAHEGINCDIVLLRSQYFYLDQTQKLEYLKSEVEKIVGKFEIPK